VDDQPVGFVMLSWKVTPDASEPMTFVIFDLLRRDGVDLTLRPYVERRRELECLGLDGPAWTT
jgi:ATP-dependent DNA ligase